MNSILNSVKRDLGIKDDYDHFDDELIMDINSVFPIIRQLGVNAPAGFSITDATTNWADYLPDGGDVLEMVKKYVAMKVRLMFDTATLTGTTKDVIERQIQEFEARINYIVDPAEEKEEEEENDGE